MRRTFLLAKLVILSLVLAFSAASRAEAEQGTIKVNWRIAGTVISGVEVTDPVTSVSKPHVLIHVQAVGSPGKAVIRALGSGPAFPSGVCLNGDPEFSIEQNDFVATFSDLSLLAAALDNGNGSFCVNLFTGEVTGEIHLVVTGGTGRFAGATGNLTINFVTRPVSTFATFAFETGEIVGTIQVP